MIEGLTSSDAGSVSLFSLFLLSPNLQTCEATGRLDRMVIANY